MLRHRHLDLLPSDLVQQSALLILLVDEFLKIEPFFFDLYLFLQLVKFRLLEHSLMRYFGH